MLPLLHDKETGESATTQECSCIGYLKEIGVTLPSVGANASDLAPAVNTTAHVGAVVVFYYPNSNLYHVALITSMATDTLTLKEANYYPCITDVRTILKSDPHIIGYWSVDGNYRT